MTRFIQFRIGCTGIAENYAIDQADQYGSLPLKLLNSRPKTCLGVLSASQSNEITQDKLLCRIHQEKWRLRKLPIGVIRTLGFIGSISDSHTLCKRIPVQGCQVQNSVKVHKFTSIQLFNAAHYRTSGFIFNMFNIPVYWSCFWQPCTHFCLIILIVLHPQNIYRPMIKCNLVVKTTTKNIL